MRGNSPISEATSNAINAISNPEVHEMIRRLSAHGLAVAVPHMHGENGEMLPLPKDKISLERNLQVSFVDETGVDGEASVPVMWRWDKEQNRVAVAAKCGLECIV